MTHKPFLNLALIILLSCTSTVFAQQDSSTNNDIDEDDDIQVQRSCAEIKEIQAVTTLKYFATELKEREEECETINEMIKPTLDKESPARKVLTQEIFDAVSRANDSKIKKITNEEDAQFVTKVAPALLKANKEVCSLITQAFEKPLKEKFAEIVKNKRYSKTNINEIFIAVTKSIDSIKKESLPKLTQSGADITLERPKQVFDSIIFDHGQTLDKLIEDMGLANLLYLIQLKKLSECKDDQDNPLREA